MTECYISKFKWLFKKEKLIFVQFFLIPSEKSELSREKESLLKKKTKEKKANKELIKMFDDKIKLSV